MIDPTLNSAAFAKAVEARLLQFNLDNNPSTFALLQRYGIAACAAAHVETMPIRLTPTHTILMLFIVSAPLA